MMETNKRNQAQAVIDTTWQLMLVFGVVVCAGMMPVDAYAGQTIGDVLCKVVQWFNGAVGQGIATLALIIIGVGALMGKVSWGLAILVGVGIAIIFGATALVSEVATTGPGGC